MRTVGLVSLTLTLLSMSGLGTLQLSAQDQPAAKQPAKAATAGDTSAEFKKLFAVRQELSAKLKKLSEQIEAAGKAKDAAGQKALIEQFNNEVKSFQEKVLPQLLAAAEPVYLKDPKNKEAESIVLGHMQELYSENQYKAVVIEANKYLEVGNEHPFLLNWAGVSRFAVQDFAGAQELLTRAKEATNGGKDMQAEQAFESLGARYLDECAPYAKMWAKEKAIREKEAAAQGEDRLPRVLMKTAKGPIEIELFENEAPNTVANFVSLVEKKYYDGIVFHRVIPNFMAQGGDPNTKDPNNRNAGSGGPGYTIPCECYQPNARMHFQGSLSMAKTAEKDTGGSQFFLTHLPTPHLNPNVSNPAMPSGHTVFGRVVKGLNIALAIRPLDKIESATVLFKRNHPYVPKTLKDPTGGKE